MSVLGLKEAKDWVERIYAETDARETNLDIPGVGLGRPKIPFIKALREAYHMGFQASGGGGISLERHERELMRANARADAFLEVLQGLMNRLDQG